MQAARKAAARMAGQGQGGPVQLGNQLVQQEGPGVEMVGEPAQPQASQEGVDPSSLDIQPAIREGPREVAPISAEAILSEEDMDTGPKKKRDRASPAAEPSSKRAPAQHNHGQAQAPSSSLAEDDKTPATMSTEQTAWREPDDDLWALRALQEAAIRDGDEVKLLEWRKVEQRLKAIKKRRGPRPASSDPSNWSWVPK